MPPHRSRGGLSGRGYLHPRSICQAARCSHQGTPQTLRPTGPVGNVPSSSGSRPQLNSRWRRTPVPAVPLSLWPPTHRERTLATGLLGRLVPLPPVRPRSQDLLGPWPISTAQPMRSQLSISGPGRRSHAAEGDGVWVLLVMLSPIPAK